MEVLLFLLLIALIVVVIYINNGLQSKLHQIEEQLTLLRRDISRPDKKVATPEEIKKLVPAEVKVEKPATPAWESGFKVLEEPVVMVNQPTADAAPAMQQVPVAEKATAKPATVLTASPSFLERHPDLERFIGENLANKIGIGILVLAIGFFVKYAIDNQWIGEVGRVGIGLLCGGILTGLAHRMRNNYAGFSSVLLGGGLAIFYFTITLAYQEYHLFSQPITFIIMVAITGFAVVLSQLYNRQELAIIALIGGFATPFMASNGSGNYKVLFIYLIILNSGLLAISYFKTWRILNILAFVFTAVLFGAWLFDLPVESPEVMRNAIVFSSIFYLLFLTINLAHNIKENKRFLASDFLIILTNTCLYFSVGLYAIDELNAEVYRGLFTASLGIFNLVLSYILFLKKRTDPNILYLLIGITVSLISLTAPIQLEGNNITLFWATETVLLYWLYKKSDIKIIQLASLLVWCALLISVMMDWVNFYTSRDLYHNVIVNRGFITMVFSAMACLALYFFRMREHEVDKARGLSFFPGGNTFFLTAVVLFFAAGFSEIFKQFNYYFKGSDFKTLYLLAYTYAFLLLLRWIIYKFDTLAVNKELTSILLITGLFINLVSLPFLFNVEIDMLMRRQNLLHFSSHWVGGLMITIILYQLLNDWKALTAVSLKQITVWMLCTYIIIFLSTELLLLTNWLFYHSRTSFTEIERVYVKTVLPILWGLSSFVFMWLGMKYKFRTLRVISLTLFTITLAKLFIFDIRNIPPTGKIAAFFCLGVLLLIISFMYQRVKKIIVDDENATA